MKTSHIVLAINISFLLIWGLLFYVQFDRPELIPLFTSFQGALNLFLALMFFLDKKRHMAIPFLVAFVVLLCLSLFGYYLIDIYFDQIKSDEMITS